MKTIPGAIASFPNLFSALALAVILCGVASCDRAPATSAAGKAEADDSNVAVAKAKREDLSQSVGITAEFLPWQDVEIHAKVAGYVKQINVDVGDHAKAGDVLATLEIPEIEDEQKQADAAVLTAQEQVKSTQAGYDETKLLAQRLSAAAKETQGLVAQQDIDTANSKSSADEANLAAAKQKVVEAQANADHLRDMVAYSRITAPFDGVVTRRYADVGALVQAGTVQSGTGGNSNSMPLVSFAELKRLRLEFPVPESVVDYVHLGDPVAVTVNATKKTFEGKVSRFAQKVDTATRTMLTEVDVDNSDFTYTPGMYARVVLTLQQKKDALTVPIQSVEQGEQPFVMMVKDGKVEKQPVTLGMQTSDRIEILDGLSEGEMVVVGNRSSLQAGQSVNPKLVATP